MPKKKRTPAELAKIADENWRNRHKKKVVKAKPKKKVVKAKPKPVVVKPKKKVVKAKPKKKRTKQTPEERRRKARERYALKKQRKKDREPVKVWRKGEIKPPRPTELDEPFRYQSERYPEEADIWTRRESYKYGEYMRWRFRKSGFKGKEGRKEQEDAERDYRADARRRGVNPHIQTRRDYIFPTVLGRD